MQPDKGEGLQTDREKGPQPSGTYRKISFYLPPDVLEREGEHPILQALMPVWAGCYVRAKGHVVRQRILPDHILIYCAEGAGWLSFEDSEGRVYRINRGDVFLCPPNQVHSYRADVESPWTKYWVHFRGTHASEYSKLLGLSLETPVCHIGEDPGLIAWFQDMFSVLRDGYTQTPLLCASAILGRILSQMVSLSRQHGKPAGPSFDVRGVLTFMRAHLDNRLPLEHLAAQAGLSKYHFSRLFKQATGYPPVEYHIRLRLQKACELLESSSGRVMEIAGILGFSSPYHFSAAFKRMMGVSPQGYRALL